MVYLFVSRQSIFFGANKIVPNQGREEEEDQQEGQRLLNFDFKTTKVDR